MKKKLLLFDIDATLLLTGGAGMRAMIRAGKELLGDTLKWDGIEPSGGLDPLLFKEAVERSGLSAIQDHDAFRVLYEAILREELKQGAHAVRALPGVLEILSNLRRRRDLILGLLTGNYARTARLKLRASGIDPEWFEVGAFGDDADSRPGLVAVAMEKYREAYNHPIPPHRVVIVGDTPRDMHSASQNGCRGFGVATGKYSIDDLKAAGADRVVKDLSDLKPLLAFLDGIEG